MQIIENNHLDIASIVRSLREGKTLVYPTETCYGLGCDALNTSAVARVFAIKERELTKSVLVIAPYVGMMMEYVEWSPVLDRIAKRYWPGALTVVAPIKEGVSLPPGIVGPNNTLAFRITSHPIACALIESLGKPLVSTSANIASLENTYDTETIVTMFQNSTNQPDMMIDAGTLPRAKPSTIVQISNERLTVVRQGDIHIDINI